MRRPLVAANWKMNGTLALAHTLVDGARACEGVGGIDVLLCPPAPLVLRVAELTEGSTVAVGAQDCSEHEAGAYTGESSAAMWREVGASHVLVGHSERRQLFGDTDERVALKAARAAAAGLCPIICVGESLEERRADATEQTVARQLDAVTALPAAADLLKHAVIAYEPVWAIGTGESATPEQAQAVHAFIRARLEETAPQLADAIRLLYGGSVKPGNAAALFAMPDIDGGLIGGASLDADAFAGICRAAAT